MKTVERFQTIDGKEFTTVEQANRHEDELLCSKLDHFLKQYIQVWHVPTRYQIVKHLVADRQRVSTHLRDILKLLEDYGDKDD